MWRSFFVQAFWNFHSLQAVGLAFVLDGIKKHLNLSEDQKKEFNLRNLSFYNGHPYFVGIPAGVIVKKEIEKQKDEGIEDSLEKFREAIASPLGAIGDTLFWSAFRPLLLLFPLYLFFAGAGDLIVVYAIVLSLLIYNAYHIKIRWWAFSEGLDLGYRVCQVFNMRYFEKKIALFQQLLYIILFGTLAASMMFLAKTNISHGLTLGALSIIILLLRKLIRNQFFLLIFALILMWISGRYLYG